MSPETRAALKADRLSPKDKSDLSRALAKALAFKACGNDAEADRWAKVLIELLRDFHIVKGVSYS